MLLETLNLKKLLKLFTKKVRKKEIKKCLELKKKKRKSDILYVQWKGCDSSFKRWIDKEDVL